MAAVSSLSFEQRTGELRSQIDRALGRYVESREGAPSRLTESIRYSLLAPAKRIRPLLVLAAAKACGGDELTAIPACCAVEMVHCYSLIHDDLPAMDDDDLRRGRPTNHKVYGEALAILAGDALLTLAFEVLAREVPAEAAASCCAALAEAAGKSGLVGGQVDDLAHECAAGDQALLESIHARKTGAMFRVSLKLGGLVAGADRRQLAALDECSKPLGLAFQVADDLLDVLGTEAQLGKRVRKDAGRGKLTFPGLIGIEASRRYAAQLVEQAVTALEPFGPPAEDLEYLARYVVERSQ